jgi:Rrf2 family protein
MHILALEEYGLRCLIQVALRDAEGPVSAQAIARAEGMGPEYVARIMGTLRAGGLVESTRGAGGGYRLARPASAISVWDAITVLGGEFFPEGFCDCHPGRRKECIHVTDCSIRALWRKTEGVLREALERISLKDLARDERTMVTWLDLEVVPRPNRAGEQRP